MLYVLIVVALVVGVALYFKSKSKASSPTPKGEPVVTPTPVTPIVTPPVVEPAPVVVPPVEAKTITIIGITPTPIKTIVPPDIHTDPGHGSWIPPNKPNRLVADPGSYITTSTGHVHRILSYVPGCLNGNNANNSATGCAANSRFTSTLTGTNVRYTFALGAGRELVIRYKPIQLIDPRYDGSPGPLRVSGATGGVTSVRMKVWLSTDPLATYDSVDPKWRDISNTFPVIAVGPGYCEIDKTVPFYYMGMSYDEPDELRFKVEDNIYLI